MTKATGKRKRKDGPDAPSKKVRNGKVGRTTSTKVQDGGGESEDLSNPARVAEITAMKKDALKSRVADIRVANPSPYNNQVVLAGYLRVANTADLLAIVEDPEHLRPLALFDAERSSNFAIPPKGKAQQGEVKKKTLFEDYLMSKQSIDQATLRSALPLSLDAFPVSRAVERSSVSWAVGMYSAIQEFPQSFTTDGDSNVTPCLADVTIENWNRAYELLRFFHRQQGAGKAVKRELRPNRPAQQPVFLTAADIKGLEEDEEGGNAQPVNPVLAIQARDHYDSDVEDLNEESKAERADQIEKTLDKVTWQRPKPGASRPPLSSSAQAGICKMLSGKVFQMHPDPSVDLCPADDPEAGWKGLDDTIKQNIDRAPLAEVAEAFKKAEKGSAAGTAATKSDKGEHAERDRIKEFWTMQSNMNRISCDEPSYARACQILDLNPHWPALHEGRPLRWQSPESRSSLDDEARDVYDSQVAASTKLYPWQVIGAAWLCLVERSSRPTCVLGDDMGLGKTITTIAFLLLSDPSTVPVPISTAVDRPGPSAASDAVEPPSKPAHDSTVVESPSDPSHHPTAVESSAPPPSQQSQQALPPPSTPVTDRIPMIDHLQKRTYKPTLLLFPSSAADVWRDEYRRHFPYVNTVYSWFRSPNVGRARDRDTTLGTSAQALVDFLTKLPDIPSTSQHVVMTSLHTLRHRSLYVKTAPAQSAEHSVRKAQARAVANQKARAKHEKARSSLVAEEDDIEDAAEDDLTTEVTEAELSQYASYLTGIFGRVCVDEAHLLKEINTYLNLAVSLLNARCIVLITGTPMINKAADYAGLLHLLYRQQLNEDDREPDIKDFDAFNDWDQRRTSKGKSTSTVVDFPDHQYLLRPDSFRKLMRPQAGEPLDPVTAHRIIRPILRMVQLRRVMASSVEANGETVRVGAGIPPYRITTVELNHLKAQSRSYFDIHNVEAKAMGLGRDEKTQETRLNFAKHRNLCHATLNPQLFRLVNNKIENVNKWYNEFEDYGATLLHQASRPAPWLPVPSVRQDMAAYMAGQSAKLSWLAGYVYHVVRERERKLLIFCAFPLTLLNVLAFLSNLGFQCLTIRSADTLTDRATTQASFNDPENNSEILITTMQVGGASLNLHHACADCLFIDVPVSANVMLQALHRIFRLGQKKTGNIVLVTLNHSYDQALQAKACKKMIPQIAGQGDVAVTDDMRANYKATHDGWDHEGVREELLDSMILLEQCLDLYQRTCGQRSSRHEWVDAYDITAKDRLIPEEKDFRVSKGLKAFEIPKGFKPLTGDEKCLLQRIRDRGLEKARQSLLDDSDTFSDPDVKDSESDEDPSDPSEPEDNDMADDDHSSTLSSHPSQTSSDSHGPSDRGSVEEDKADDSGWKTPLSIKDASAALEGHQHPLEDLDMEGDHRERPTPSSLPDLTRQQFAEPEGTHVESRARFTAPGGLLDPFENPNDSGAQRRLRRSSRNTGTKQ